MEPFIGQIMMFGGNFAPRGWALCNGQTLSIAQNTALYSILGITYGGNGQTTFALPDLRGRVPMSSGQGPGLSPRTLGETAGEETVTLLNSQMPAHNHMLSCDNNPSNQTEPSGNLFGAESASATQVYSSGPANALMNVAALSASGGSQPHDNMPPYQCVNFIIALEGIFPSRN
ncbi:MAG TPA: tail fiber protein [Bryobacteraceae bacterium]|nr:tail fiber protein [Bryobacteraceae bacterium]